jgi:hypothetical protein
MEIKEGDIRRMKERLRTVRDPRREGGISGTTW